jgi:hypothetical protein
MANDLHYDDEGKRDAQTKRARVTEEQIIAVLKEHEAGTKTADLARMHGISEATLYGFAKRWQMGTSIEGLGHYQGW